MKLCKVEDCQNKYLASGYCNKHYIKYKPAKNKERTMFDPNEFIMKGNICEVVLYDAQGREKARTTVDSEDYCKVKNKKWHLTSDGYAASGVGSSLFMHHAIMGRPINGKETDHEDRNKLNNRKYNLRSATRSENSMNIGKKKNTKSGFRGVYWNGNNGNWNASVQYKRKQLHLGVFVSKIEAAKAYNKAVLKYHGEFAKLNHLPPIRRSCNELST